MGILTKKEQSTRPPKKLIERLRAFTTPELCDGAGLYHSMDYQIKPWIGRTKIVGPAVTVDVPSGEGGVCGRKSTPQHWHYRTCAHWTSEWNHDHGSGTERGKRRTEIAECRCSENCTSYYGWNSVYPKIEIVSFSR